MYDLTGFTCPQCGGTESFDIQITGWCGAHDGNLDFYELDNIVIDDINGARCLNDDCDWRGIVEALRTT